MPTTIIGNVPFNVYPIAKAKNDLIDVISALYATGESVATDIYLGNELQRQIGNYLELVAAIMPKLKAAGVAEVGISKNLVGCYPAIAIFVETHDLTIPRLLAKAAKIRPSFRIEETVDGYILASTLLPGQLRKEPLNYNGFNVGGSSTAVNKALVPILGTTYASFLQDLAGSDLFSAITKTADTVARTKGTSLVHMAARALAVVGQRTVPGDDQAHTALGTLQLHLPLSYSESDDDADWLVTIDQIEADDHLKLPEAMKAYFKKYPIDNDLMVASSKVSTRGGGLLTVTFEAPDLATYKFKDLGL